MAVKDEKYVVFKRGEWDEFIVRLVSALSSTFRADYEILEPNPLRDAVVIRTQDVFATQGLYAYAHEIQFALELMQMTDTMREGLEGVRDYFFERAREAEERMRHRGAKLPD